MSADFTWRAGRCRSVLVGVLVAVLIGGCEEEGIRVYEAPKDPPARQVADVSGADRGPQGDAVPPMNWQTPDEWAASSREMPMRLATYYAGGGDEADERLEVAVSAFPGEAGGTLANVNRWREQLGLGPVTQADLEPDLHAFSESGQVHGYTLRIDPDPAAPDARGMLGAIIHSPGHEYTWFVRAFGRPAQLEAYEAEVRAFAHTFELAGKPMAHGHSQDHGDGYAPERHASVPQPVEADGGENDSPNGTAGSAGAELTLQKPADWRQIERTSSIVYASYEVGPPQGSASIVVTPLAGDAGMFANVNMWRQQIGLPAFRVPIATCPTNDRAR